MTQYVAKPCLFCPGGACFEELYPRNFRDEDLNPAVFSARRVTEHFHYRMVRCRETGLVFSREVLPDAMLEQLYAESHVTFNAYAGIIRRDYWKPFAPFAAEEERGAALEIGCSTGFFLEELLDRGYREVHGCEPSAEARRLASPRVAGAIRGGLFSDSLFPDARFDLVCSFQTLDHAADPAAMLAACFRKTRPGGLLYLIVHDAEGLQARLFGEKSPIIDVEHIYLFSRKTLALAAARAGYQPLSVFPIRNSYPLEYWITHAPIPFRRAIAKAAQASGLGRLRLPLSLGNIGMVARKPAEG
ncbi:MAG: class I SAM-dependent methyltransferase [Fibrobacteres bacterium]|nr:class I SAM-dependent methyltransferase [Fibrobacterota bacterium]